MKKLNFFVIFFIALIFLTGCGRKATELPNNFRDRRPDFGQPERVPDISGIVKSIKGNEVVILKIERPNREEFQQQMENVENAGEEQQAPAASLGGGRMMPGGGMGMRGRQNMDESQQEVMLERMKEMSVGEEKITIPVGIQMLRPDTDSENNTPEMLEATLDDITENKMLTIWLDETITDKNVASFVLINR